MDTRKETMFNKVPEYANIVEVIEINSWVSEYTQNMTKIVQNKNQALQCSILLRFFIK